jgi:hypothetical protein
MRQTQGRNDLIHDESRPLCFGRHEAGCYSPQGCPLIALEFPLYAFRSAALRPLQSTILIDLTLFLT